MPLITAYYFRAHTYTLVPRHVREDMEWMADHGTDAVAIGILEQDLYAAVENYLFMYGFARGYPVERMARITTLHDFGCDGRPYSRADGGSADSDTGEATKCLIEDGPYFIEQAEKNGKNGLMLIENHAMPSAETPYMDRRLPEILNMGAGHILYYYYPRSLDNPDDAMAVLGKHLTTHL